MDTGTESRIKYLTLLQFLRNKYQETDDQEDKQRIGNLLDGEADCQVRSKFKAELKTEEAKRLVGRACQIYIVKHVLNLSAELKSIK